MNLKRSPMKRNTKPMRKSHGKVANAAEREYMGRVAALGCIVCSECLGYQDTPAIVHHIRTGQGKNARKSLRYTATLPNSSSKQRLRRARHGTATVCGDVRS